MIRFEPVAEPADSREKAITPGTAWLASHPDADRPKDYWTPFKGALARGFRDLCVYSAMYEPVGSVDHFVSCHEDLSTAYEWENYRYCAAWINSSKGNTPAANLLAGSCSRYSQPTFWARLDTVIWLDPPILLLLQCVILRSWRRWRRRELLWGTNVDLFWTQFTLWRMNDSLIDWIFSRHARWRRAVLA